MEWHATPQCTNYIEGQVKYCIIVIALWSIQRKQYRVEFCPGTHLNNCFSIRSATLISKP